MRFTQPPNDLFEWYEEYLQDEEEIDVKAGGGCNITIGQMCRQFMTKLDWFSTLFPRIPVQVQKSIEQKLNDYDQKNGIVANNNQRYAAAPAPQPQQTSQQEQPARRDRERFERNDRQPKEYRDERRRSPERRRYEDDSSRHSKRSHSREKHSSKSAKHHRGERSRSRSKDEKRDKDRRKHDYDDAARSSSRRY